MSRVAAMSPFGALLMVLLLLFQSAPAAAHEIRPAYLDMRETTPDVFAIVWKVPALGDRRLSLYARLPDECTANTEPATSFDGGAYIERWTAACDGGVKGRDITIDGLRSTMTDALVHITYRNGTTEILRVKPDVPTVIVAGAQTGLEVAATYFRLGVDHILSGFDHLLFVLALMLLIHNPWTLAKTITAFTLAHSITLAVAALGYFSLPQKPVEATIALSIAFVASELTKIKPGERRLSESYPWMVAFGFGLLHGFGFAGALKEIGLPQVDVPLALLTFNLGVEAGQMLFVAAVLISFRSITVLVTVPIGPARLTAAYLIGTMAAGWLITRLTGFVV
jgi:hydrogenase/urease accessory protein HupE